jgi:DNA topoisomerase-2
VTGGRNGCGAKLANVFSTEFIVECADVDRPQFQQVFVTTRIHQGLPSEVCTAAELKQGDYVKITFSRCPVQRRHLDEDIVGLMSNAPTISLEQ